MKMMTYSGMLCVTTLIWGVFAVIFALRELYLGALMSGIAMVLCMAVEEQTRELRRKIEEGEK